jgi:hypothetical protein
VLELPETLEEIVVWKLEHGQVERYLLYVQKTQPGSWPELYMDAHALVVDWLVRIGPLNVVTSNRTVVGETDYHMVSVAGIRICTVTRTEHNEIFGVTDA